MVFEGNRLYALENYPVGKGLVTYPKNPYNRNILFQP